MGPSLIIFFRRPCLVLLLTTLVLGHRFPKWSRHRLKGSVLQRGGAYFGRAALQFMHYAHACYGGGDENEFYDLCSCVYSSLMDDRR